MTRRVDITIAAAVFVLTLGLIAVHGFGTPGLDARDLDTTAVALAAASAVPLVWRRRYPLPVYLATGVAALALLALRYPLDVPIGVLVAVYTVALSYSGDPRRRRRVLVLVAINEFVPAVAITYALRDGHMGDVAPPLVAWAMVILGVWIAADRNRLKRERISELESRARHAEAEADRDRRLIAAEERTRIARELHDSAGHAINVILVQAGAARLLADRDPDRSRRAIETVETVAHETLVEIDRIVRVLRGDERDEPPTLADPGAIDELIDRHRDAGLSIATQLYGPRDAIPQSVAQATYRILQEALTNAARHGSGSADMTVFFGPEELQITVTNPLAARPRSADPDRDPAGGHGIVGMRERAYLVGGTLQAGPYSGHFRLHARLPCQGVAAPGAAVGGATV